MSREKQIEEVAKVMCGYYGTEKCYDCRYCCDCHIKHEADRLYKAGYRKQSEGEWIKDNTSKFENRYNCSVCDFRQIGKPTPYCPNCGSKMKGV